MFLDKSGSKNWSSISLLYIFVRYSSISKLLYLCFEFNGYFFKSFLIHIFFWQICSQNLKFSKLTEIWCRGSLLYADHDFNACFFKILFLFIFFGQIRLQNLKFFKLTEISCRVTLLYAYYYFNVYFFKFFAIHIILGKFGFKI